MFDFTALLLALDLSLPALAPVKTALECGDASGAARAFAEHLRTRNAPRWHFDSQCPPANASPEVIEVADKALEHTFVREGIPHTFGPKIDWAYNPTAEPDSPQPLNHEWTWQLSRHYEWPKLAVAFNTTGEARYARGLAAQIRSWGEENPTPERIENGPYSRWRTIEAGIRMCEIWPDVFWGLLAQRELFPDDVLLLMVDCMRRHAEYLDKYPTSGNWLFMEANGEFHVGVLFPEFKEATKWRQNALNRLEQALDRQVYPDGVQYELTPHYHNVTIDNALAALELADLNGIAVSPSYRQQLEKMFAVNLWAMTPDRDVPPLNDSGHIDVRGRLANALRFFPHRKDFSYIATDGREGEAPDQTSYCFPWAGWAVMRSGWDERARFLLFDGGPFGYSHQHEDKLSFVLHAYGSKLVFDAGSYSYNASAMRDYVISARGHNVVHVDGLEQYRGGYDWNAPERALHLSSAPVPFDWYSTDQFDYAAGSYGREPVEAWGPERQRPAIHTRRILFVKPDFWIVVDSLVPADEGPHLYESTFHINAPQVWVEAGGSRVETRQPDEANLTLLPVSSHPFEVRVVCGQEEPVFQGWLPETRGYYQALERPVVSLNSKVTGPVHFFTILAPSPPGGVPSVRCVQRVELDGAVLAARLELDDSTEAHLTLSHEGTFHYTGPQGVFERPIGPHS